MISSWSVVVVVVVVDVEVVVFSKLRHLLLSL